MIADWQPLLVDFGGNLALLISLTFLYGFLGRKFSRLAPSPRALVDGVLFGAIAVVGMQIPMHIAEGIIVDGRTVIVMLAGVFCGPLAGIVAAAVVGAFRLYLGGVGTIAGVGAIATAAAVGIVYHWYTSVDASRVRAKHLLGLAAVMTPVSLAWVLALPAHIPALPILERLIAPVGIMYPLATVLLGLMLSHEHRRLRMVDELRVSEARFRDFAESSSDWLWEMGPDLRYTYFSDRVEEVVGISPEFHYGKTREELAGEDINTEKWQAHLAALERHEPFKNFQYYRQGPSGQLQYLSTSGIPIFGDDGDFQGYRGTGTDITVQRAAEVDRDKALRAAEQASKAKSEFLATMSHEFRTPLNAILGFSDILSNQYFGPPGQGKYREYAYDIHASAEHLLELVEDLLDISTIEAGKASLDRQVLPTGQIISECLRTIEEKAQADGIVLDPQVPGDIPPLFADRRAIKQILLNLLSNAIKFTPAGGAIRVQVSADGQIVRIDVADTGPGIDKDQLPHVTNPFTRGGLNAYTSDPGWGLGLAISQALVDLHDGEMYIDSIAGEGTTVSVRLAAGAPQQDVA